jgi:hypothetical protein
MISSFSGKCSLACGSMVLSFFLRLFFALRGKKEPQMVIWDLRDR